MIKKFLTLTAILTTTMFAAAITAPELGFVLATEMNAEYGCGTTIDEYAEGLDGVCITFGEWADTNNSKLRLDLEISQYADMQWATPWMSIESGMARIVNAVDTNFVIMLMRHVIVIYPQEKE